jgi:hypothetical protein
VSGMVDWRVRRALVVAVEENNDGLSTIDIAERGVVVLLRLPYSSGVVPVSCRGI